MRPINSDESSPIKYTQGLILQRHNKWWTKNYEMT